MKIAVITMHAVKNYGSVLQTYATQRVLEDKDIEVEIINYIRKKNLDSNLSSTWTRSDNGPRKIIKRILLQPTIKRWKQVFNGYLEQNIKTSSSVYTCEEDFKLAPIQADVFCTGSDQVWNSGWNDGVETPFYLTFVPDNVPKIALAASIGKSELDQAECRRVFPLLRRYDYISMRETSSVSFLKESGFNNVEFCLDPTQLLSREQWLEHAVEYRGMPEKYVLIYQLNHDKQFDHYAVEFARKKGLPLYRICTRYDQVRLSGKPLIIPQVQQWLSLVANAEYVLTNSFHATAFCINLNTQFVSIFPNEYSCRIEDVLRLYGLEDRRLKSYDQLDIADKQIDFNRTNLILNENRERCLKLIKKMIHDAMKAHKGTEGV